MTLPTDQFDKLLSRLIGLPNGAHTQPTVVQAVDFYGNTTSYMVQTVKTEEGPTVFLTQVNYRELRSKGMTHGDAIVWLDRARPFRTADQTKRTT